MRRRAVGPLLRSGIVPTGEGAPRGHHVLSLPVMQFHPRSAPLRGRTRVTLCGTTFRSPPDPAAHRRPLSSYRVAVGGRSCAVLLNESWVYRCRAREENVGGMFAPPSPSRC